MAPEMTADVMVKRLGRHKSYNFKLARDGEAFESASVYIAPPDFHLLVKDKVVLVTKGARENRYRPSVDPLFRSAAVSHGPRVIGVILSGMLDDGTAGMTAIQRCGGATVVQDPKDAAYPAMPQSVLNNVKVGHSTRLAEMGALLATLIRQSPGKPQPIPQDIRTEAEIAERVLSDVAQVEGLGSQVPYNCPNCGGVLWHMGKSAALRYRCHTGHSFTAAALVDSQSEKIEETLWTCLRMLEERKNLMTNMAQKESRARSKSDYVKRSKDAEAHIKRIRAMLLARG